jgi:hypothetical protein
VTTTPRPDWFTPEEPTDVIQSLKRIPAYRDLVTTYLMAQRAATDWTVGDGAALNQRVTELTEEVAAASGFTAARVRSILTNNATPPERGLGPAGENALRGVAGLLDPLNLPGDATRTFTVQLRDVQRDREVALGRLRSDSPGTFTGAPAENVPQAIGELWQAWMNTGRELGFTEPPLIRTTKGWTINPESWAIYLPDWNWIDGERYGAPSSAHTRAPTGVDFIETFGIDARLGIADNEKAKQWVGFGVEFALDPLVAGDFLFMGGKALKLAGAPQNVVNAVEGAGRSFYRATSPAGLLENAVENPLTGWLVGPIMRNIEKSINWVLDLPMPFGTSTLPTMPPGTGRAAAAAGWADGVPPVLLRDVFFQGGVAEWLTSPWGRPRWMTGGEQYGISAAERAAGTADVVNRIAHRGIEEYTDALTAGLRRPTSYRIPSMRFANPIGKSVPPALQGYVGGLGNIVSDFVDSVGTATTGMGWRNAGIPPEFSDRLRQLSEAFDIPYDQTLARFKDASESVRRTTLQIGYETSGYRYVTDAMQVAAARLGLDYNDVRRAYELYRPPTGDLAGWTTPGRSPKMHGVDIQSLEARGFFQGVVPGSTGAVAADGASMLRARTFTPQQIGEFEEATRTALREMGLGDNWAMIDFRTYVDGMRDGYFRRMFMTHEDAVGALGAVEQGRVVVMRNVDIDDISAGFASTYDDEVGDAARALLNALSPSNTSGRGVTLPQGTVSTDPSFLVRVDDFVSMVSRKVGRDIPRDEVYGLLFRDDPQYTALSETLSMLKNNVTTGGSSGVTLPFARPVAAFSARENLSPEMLAQLLQIHDPTIQLAAMGVEGGRAARSMSMLRQVATGLRNDGLLLTHDDILQDLAARVAPNQVGGVRRAIGGADILPFRDTQNNKWILIPEGAHQWGPLAGTAIPEGVARTLLMSARFNQPGPYERLLGMWRKGMLAPLGTSIRNVVGNFAVIGQAGGDVGYTLAAVPRAVTLRNQLLDTGRLPEEFRGYEHLFSYINDAGLYRSVERTMEEALVGMIQRADPSSTGWPERLFSAVESVNDVATTLPPFGYLRGFQFGEEVSRTAAFLSTYDQLTMRGVAKPEAIERAAHFAVNSAYNYGALPLLPQLLRNTGLSAFPQFAYFTIGRTFRAVGERPATLARSEYVRQGINTATGDNEREQVRVSAMLEDFLRISNPALTPWVDERGNRRVFDFGYWVPQGSDPASILADPLLGGFAQGILNAADAHRNGTGFGFAGARYGRRTFNPADDAEAQMRSTIASTASEYILPGLWRTGRQLADTISFESADPDAYLRWSLANIRYYNLDYTSFALRYLGVGTRLVGTDQIDITRRLVDMQNSHKVRTDALARQIREATVGPHADPAEAARLMQRLFLMEQENQELYFRFLRAIQ